MSVLLWTALSVAAVGTWGTSMRAMRRRQLVARRLSLLDDGPDLVGPRFEGLRLAWVDGLAQLRRAGTWRWSPQDRRRRTLSRSVAPLLDRIVCRMAVGMSFESAVGAVVREHPQEHRLLKAELMVYLQETRLGHAPREALIALSRRCGVPELDRVVGTLLMGRDPVTLREQLLACALGLHAEVERRQLPPSVILWAIALACYVPALLLVWSGR